MRAPSEAVIWHDVECGAYEADLPLWADLAEAGGSSVLELGSGTGRVSVDLARRGSAVLGIDSSPELIGELRHRIAAQGLELEAETADASDFALQRSFSLIVAPMQLIQLLDGAEARARCLRGCASHLDPGGRVALAIVEGAEVGAPPFPPLPDVREIDGWVYSSLPLGVGSEGDSLLVERLREAVSPDGRLSESRNSVRLRVVSADSIEREARAAGLRPVERLEIEPTDAHVGSTVVLLEA